MVTEKVYNANKRKRTQEWCQTAQLPEIHGPNVLKYSPGGQQSGGTKVQENLLSGLSKSIIENPSSAPLSCPHVLMFHGSYFMLHILVSHGLWISCFMVFIPSINSPLLVRAECVRCPWLLAQNVVATTVGIIFLLSLFSLRPLLFYHKDSS
jgi:hypothetical protein